MFNGNTSMGSDTAAFLTSVLTAVSIVGLVIYIILAFSLYQLFQKSDEKGWKAIVPICNIYTLMKIAGMNPWAVLLLIVPVVNLFVLALLSVRVASKFEKGAGFAIGLLFLPFVCYPILAFTSGKENVTKEKHISKKEPRKSKKIEEDEESIICPNCDTKLAKDATSCFICGQSVVNEDTSVLMESESVKEETPTLYMPEEPSEEPILVEPLDYFEREVDPVMKESLQIADEYNSASLEEPSISHTFEPMPSYEMPLYTDKEAPLDIDSLPLEDISPLASIDPVETIHPDPVPEKPKYKSSTKTLDEILRINNDLYAEREATLEKKKNIESEKIASEDSYDEIEITLDSPEMDMETLLQETDDLLKRIKQHNTEVDRKELHKEELIQHVKLWENSHNEVGEDKNSIPSPSDELNDEDYKTRKCKSCGSTIPRYSTRCLLCGTVDEE